MRARGCLPAALALALLAALAVATPGRAEAPAPEAAPLPPARPAAEAGVDAGADAGDAPAAPAGLAAMPEVPVPKARTPAGTPQPRPEPGRQVAVAAPRPEAPRRDAPICEDPRLVGTERANLVGPVPGCAIYAPVRLTEIAGIRLSTPATLDCRTARQFANWLSGIAQPEARRQFGARIDKLWIMGSYSCRTRNNRAGARLSEHSAGRAIDIGGLWLGDGRQITVLGDWGKGAEGAFLRTLWQKACGPFKTVLGPQSDRFHLDHLHLDTAYRERAYCR